MLVSCLPLIGLVSPIIGIIAIGLGIMALTRASRGGALGHGRGMAIVGIVMAACSLPLALIMYGVTLPAIGAARTAARQVKSAAQLGQIAKAMAIYSNDYAGSLPEPGANVVKRFTDLQLTSPEIWQSPNSESTGGGRPFGPDYLIIPAAVLHPTATNKILLIENPWLVPGQSHIVFHDMHVELRTVDDVKRLLRSEPTIFTPDGTLWTPPIGP